MNNLKKQIRFNELIKSLTPREYKLTVMCINDPFLRERVINSEPKLKLIFSSEDNIKALEYGIRKTNKTA